MKQLHALIAVLALGAGIAGCSEPKAEPDPRAAALSDPMNYNPAAERYDVSGGGILELNKKAFRKDVDSVLSP